jgi:4-hydroxy-tetrahydrodipicolinate synthase
MLYVPLITPFTAAGTIAVDALQTLADSLLRRGATGLVALGTTGEPAMLTSAERRTVIAAVTDVCRDRDAHLIVGANDAAALRDARGATAALCLVPPFLRPGEDGTIAHFAGLAATSPVPLIAYHVPYRTAQPLTAAALLRLAAIPAVTGIKYATGALDTTAAHLIADAPADFTILGGDDELIAPMLALGASGGILASAHLAPAAFTDLIAAWHRGDLATARPLGHRLAALSRALFAEPNPAVIKGVLHAQGHLPTPSVRLPLLPASPAAITAAAALLPPLTTDLAPSPAQPCRADATGAPLSADRTTPRWWPGASPAGGRCAR